ncbi:nitric oxide reductase activation protein NorD [Prosthecomicrobium sp. N25]|uniref:nitric oxide reductase activation protein NorD n=1 Tax=Prosthecomicrobium sp. N25 TaxID=3129254 RepID=UPI003077C834
MSLFEPEETVGLVWHRLVGGAGSYRRHPAAAVRLEAVRGRLGVMFRAFGGAPALRLAESAPTVSRHRLGLAARIGIGAEKLAQPALDATTLRLPPVVDVYPDAADNALLYEWLVAWFAVAGPVPTDPDPLRADLLRLRAAVAASAAALAAWPGLGRIYHRLRAATLAVRPVRSLPPAEADVEAAIRAILGAARPAALPHLDAIEDRRTDLSCFAAPRGYRPFLPIPLFGAVEAGTGSGRPEQAEDPDGRSVTVDARRRKAERRDTDQSDRDDPLVLHRFETIFSLAEMVNVNRKVEDDDEEGARQAADDLPDLTIGANQKRAATRLKMDLDLAPADAEGDALAGAATYPEWDWKKQAHRPDHCRVLPGLAPSTGEDWAPDAAMQRQIASVRRQFEALRPKRVLLPGQADGDDLDLAALVRDVADRRAGGPGTERLFVASRAIDRDLSVAVLMDVSLSTDAWIGTHRVLDVEKAALLALTHGLTACGDEHAIFTFTSRKRGAVRVDTVKGYDETLGRAVTRRIEALKPGEYTRMGAAVRHVARGLAERPHRHRLLLVLTDGKPNDIDYYEGRYGIEDTRMAIREAREEGLRVFGVTVDEAGRDYFPYIFGRGAHAIVSNPERLPTALPAIYRHLVR